MMTIGTLKHNMKTSKHSSRRAPKSATTKTIVGVHVLDFLIAGVVHYEHQLCDPDSLKAGIVLGAVAEPSNQFDRFAIRIENQQGYKLGYVPRDQTGALHSYRKAGIKLHFVLLSNNPTNPTHRQYNVRVMAERAYTRHDVDAANRF